MKHNWEYTDFNKIAQTITPNVKIDKSSYLENGVVPIVSQEDSLISGYWDNISDITPHKVPVVIFGDHSRVVKYVEFDFVVGADGVKIIQPKNCVSTKFLYHYLKWYNVPSLGYSRHFKLLKDAKYPVPPMAVQERIVAELDEINGLIEAKREQLKQLDLLSQSIFYTMFGDPVSNPMGWETHKFSSTFKLKSGSGLSTKDIETGSYPVYGGNGVVGYHNQFNITGDKIIIGRVGALCGNVRYVKGNAYITDNAFILTHQKGLDNIFTLYLLNLSNLRQYAKAVAQPVISNVALKDLSVILPPLDLQQLFAAKVESIETRKADIEATIKELQTLLDSRMDYWFN